MKLKAYDTRSAIWEDLETVFELVVANDIFEYGQRDTELGDLRGDWEDVDLDQDTLVVVRDEKIIGYAAVFDKDEGFYFDFFTDPHQNLDELNEALVICCESRMLEMIIDEGKQERDARIYVDQVKNNDSKMLIARGYEPENFYFRMSIDFDQPRIAQEWDADWHVRTIRVGEEDQQVFDLVYEAFDWAGRGDPPKFEDWKKFMMREDHFLPELWFLLFKEETLVGVALCFDYEHEGWVRQLAVKPAWQNQGLGGKLLTYTFDVFYQRSKGKVSLVVDSKNEDANKFYESAGMTCVRQHIRFRKKIKTR